MNIAVILAAGKGTRVRHADKPKQYLDIGGKPILCHTVGKFLACKQIGGDGACIVGTEVLEASGGSGI